MEAPHYLIWTDTVGYESTIYEDLEHAKSVLAELKGLAAYRHLEMQVRKVYLSDLDERREIVWAV